MAARSFGIRAFGFLTLFPAAVSVPDSTSAQTKIAVPGAPTVEMVLIPVPAGADVDTALSQVIEKVGAAQGGVSAHSQPTQVKVAGTTMRIETVSFNRMPGYGFFFLTVPQGSGICMAAMPMNQAGQAARATGEACLNALGKGGGGNAAAPAPNATARPRTAPATARPAPATSAAPAAHSTLR